MKLLQPISASVMPGGFPFREPSRVTGVGGRWSLVDIFEPGETMRAEELRRRNEELNKRKIAAGQMTAEQAQAQQARFDEGDPSTWNKEVAQEFISGAGDAIKKAPKAFRDALSSAAGYTLSFIPWWVWAGGVVAALHFLGVFDGLKGSLSTRRRTS